MLYNDKELYNFTVSVTNLFHIYTNWKPCNIEFLCSDNLHQDILAYTGEDLTDKEFKAIYLPANDNHKPIVCLPYTPDTLSNPNLKCQLFICMLHELTHAYDYTLFCETYCHNDYTQIKPHELYRGIFYWSEYHARRISNKIYLNEQILKQQVHLPFAAQEYYDLTVKNLKHTLSTHGCLNLYDIISFIATEDLYNDFQTLMLDKPINRHPFDFHDDDNIRQMQMILHKKLNFQSVRWHFRHLKNHAELYIEAHP